MKLTIEKVNQIGIIGSEFLCELGDDCECLAPGDVPCITRVSLLQEISIDLCTPVRSLEGESNPFRCIKSKILVSSSGVVLVPPKRP